MPLFYRLDTEQPGSRWHHCPGPIIQTSLPPSHFRLGLLEFRWPKMVRFPRAESGILKTLRIVVAEKRPNHPSNQVVSASFVEASASPTPEA